MRHAVVATVFLLTTGFFAPTPLIADTGAQPEIDRSSLAEVVNGFAILLSAENRASGEPVLKLLFINAGTEPFDIVEVCPMFLEVEGPERQWRSYQHPMSVSDKVGDLYTFDVGHIDPAEHVRVSRFAALNPGKHRVRVSMTVDSGMVRGRKSECLWTGMVRSNIVEITVPEQKDGEK